MNLSEVNQIIHADESLQTKLAQLSALSHVMADESFSEWGAGVTGPLRDLFASLGADIARMTNSPAT